MSRPYFLIHFISLLCFCVLATALKASAQQDSVKLKADSAKPVSRDSFFLLRSKGLLGKLAKSIVTDTGTNSNLQRIDKLYAKYRGRVIRHIEIRRVDFGVPINDTTRSFKTMLTRGADALHHTTREYVISNNLFFKENDTLLPILLADNERHLRDQTYLADAKIIVKNVLGTRDSVDVIVLTKDVLSIGGRFRLGSLNRADASIREDNFMGLGDKFEVSGLYDQERRTRFGYGAEYSTRNIAGSFTDGYFGFQNFAPTFNSFHRQETTVYTRFIRPLVNPYMKWTYALEGAWHKTSNMYMPDSFYLSDNRYQYYNVDAWIGYNIRSHLSEKNKDDRLRTLLGLRFLHTDFQQVPVKYEEQYFYQFANITGILGSVSLFRQDFYKTQYVYGFGRHEDVPEGLDVSVTSGWTNKQQRVRPYFGLDMQFNYFSPKENYFNYALRVGGYSYKKKYEDVSILGSLEYFTRLKEMGKRWKQRTFLNASFTTQIKRQLNEPLLLESQYGLQEYQDIRLGGDHRLTLKYETVFFNNWSLFSFRFAPFVFANGSFLTPVDKPLLKTTLYSTIGAGIRSRNESLVFGTMELRTYFFPTKNFNGDRFRIDFNTGIKFKYNNQTVRRPQFTGVN